MLEALVAGGRDDVVADAMMLSPETAATLDGYRHRVTMHSWFSLVIHCPVAASWFEFEVMIDDGLSMVPGTGECR